MGFEVVLQQDNGSGVGEVDVRQILKRVGIIDGGMTVGECTVGFGRNDPLLPKMTLENVFLRVLSRDNLDENGGGNQSLKRQPVAKV